MPVPLSGPVSQPTRATPDVFRRPPQEHSIGTVISQRLSLALLPGAQDFEILTQIGEPLASGELSSCSIHEFVL